ncbi:MAG: mandelate racemase/muconate lactonizing enzyme family protein [Marmoricola sp.]|nr:mandelate racemase/muconate lactonizing enzyme family protein [Marmoricola sp.]
MLITRLQAFTYDAAYSKGDYSMSGGRVSPHQPALVLRIDTDEGLVGWGETCPHGRTYLPSFFEGELAALTVLAPLLIGQDPRNLAAVHEVMDRGLLGSNAAKAVVDFACWDLLGKALEVPAHQLLGGRLHETLPLFTALPVADASEQAALAADELALGVRVFQVKVGDDPIEDSERVRAVVEAVGPESTVLADANGGWDLPSALVAASRLADLPVRLEQPCSSMADCAELRRHTLLPLVLDESVVTLADLVHAKHAAGANGVNIKPSRVGGLLKARQIRDAAQALGMVFNVDDTWGGSLATAQIAAVAAGAAQRSLMGVTSFARFTRPSLGAGADEVVDGRAVVPEGPGLGVEVQPAVLGDALMDTQTRR